MRIIIFTDSLGRPRPDLRKEEKTVYEDVYGYKLKEYFKNDEVELLYIDSLDTNDAIYWSQRMVAFRKPDLVIYQFGINDCVPRLFKKNSNSIILNRFFRKLTFDFFLKLMSYYRKYITRIYKLVYVENHLFKQNIENMILEVEKYNKNVKFINLSILNSNRNNVKSYNYNHNIQSYNSILKNIFKSNYVELNDYIDDSGLISDGLHLTKESHEIIFNLLKNKIKDMY